MPANFKIVLEEGRVNSPDSGNFFPRFIQPIADSPDSGDDTKISSSSKNYDKPRTLPGATKKPTKSSKMFGLRQRESSDGQLRGGKKKPNTTEDVDLQKRAQNNRRAISANTRYGSPQSDNRLSIISNSSSMDSLPLEGDNQLLPVYKLASAEFELEYTGGPGADEGYYRKSKLSITIRILPAFHFSHFDILPCTE